KRLSEKKPIECIKLSEEETARWLDKTQYLQDEHVEQLENKGLPGKEFLNAIKETVERLNKEYPDVQYGN
ncbi:MAG TPA: hypothetical protein GXZ27_11590, partial [Thermoanaerobacterales bacterium]|nr:hypothetical protein [Thermoanaerobacterales bacterium]